MVQPWPRSRTSPRLAGVIGAADPDGDTGGLDVQIQVAQGQLADLEVAVDLQGEMNGGLATGGSVAD